MLTRLAISLLMITLGFATPGRGAEDPAMKPSQGAFVVIVGVSTFADTTIQPRPTADADAKDVYDLFADKTRYDIAPERIRLLTSKADEKRKGLEATRENVVKALHEAVTQTGKDDVIILAFFGRGASAGDKTCLFASDSTFKNRAKDGVLGSDIANELKLAKNQKIALLMDVSYHGYDAGKESIVEPSPRDITNGLFGEADKEDKLIPPDRLLMMSCFPSDEPLVKGDHSLFGTVVLEGLRGAADNSGYEPDGLIVADEIGNYVEKELSEQARLIGKNQKEKETLPLVVGERTSHFTMALNPKATGAVAKRLTALADLEKNGQINKELAAEGKGLLARMPKLKGQQELRKKFQALADGKLAPADFADAAKAIKASMVLNTQAAEAFASRVGKAIDLLDARYVKKIVPADLTVATIRGIYRRLEEPIPELIETELKNSKNWDRDAIEAILRQARSYLGKREDLDGNKDADLGISVLLFSLNDPYTVYFDKETIKKAESQLRGQFSGVGIQIRRDLVNDALLVVSPIKDSPAYKAGIQAGDLIVGIKRDRDPEGKPLPPDAPREFTTKGMKTEQALDIILGKPDEPITLVIQREGETKPIEYNLKRGRIAVETVLGVKRDEKDAWSYFLDDKEKIAYIHLTQFAPATDFELLRVMKSLQLAGMKGLILDLRYNPGGVLEGARDISDMFIKDGKIVTIRPRVGREDVLKDRGIADFTDFPLAVMVNEMSASASEIVSACLQDYGRAVIVGTRSYGKGSVQHVRPFEVNGELLGQIKMTTARYFPPSDRNIDKLSSGGKTEDEWGVKPDKGYEVKLSREETRDLEVFLRDLEIIPRKGAKPKEKDKEKKEFVDRQKEKAIEYIREQIKAGNARK